MVNIRFHIVSITAVFLALAVGIFMGSSLLDRTTVDSLKTTQDSLEKKIEQRGRENDAFRERLGVLDAQNDALMNGPTRKRLSSALTDPVIVIAARGVDGDALQKVVADLKSAGQNPGGIIWWDERASLVDDIVRNGVAASLGINPGATASVMRRTIQTDLVERITDYAANQVQPKTPLTEVGADPLRTLRDLLVVLHANSVIRWDPVPGEEVAQLPAAIAGSLRVVVISGEGATPGQTGELQSLAIALSAQRPGSVVAGEMLVPRSSIDSVAVSLVVPPIVRGSFVDVLRADTQAASILATIDDLDRPFGRLALLGLLGGSREASRGAFGETPTATAPFPSGE